MVRHETRRGTGAGLSGVAAAVLGIGLGLGIALPAAAQTTTTTAPTTTTTAPTTTTTAPTTTTTAPPGSTATPPPGWKGGSGWVAFTFGRTSLGQNHKGEWWGPVTITRHSSAGLDVASAFEPGSWDSRPSATPGEIEYGWPEDWELGGLRLRRVRWCDRAAPTCDYRVTGGATGERLFFAAGAPASEYEQYDQGPVFLDGTVPVLDIVFSWDPNTSVTPAVGATPGKLTLDASGTTDQMSGDLSFEWTVTNQATGEQLQATGPVASFDLDTNGSYCVAVTVTNADDPDNPSTYGVDTPDCKPISNVAPVPGTAPGVGNGGGGAGGGAGGINVVFAPPRRSSSALTGTAGGDSVVWLWRPEYFQPGAESTRALPQTGRNPLEGRTDIVIATDPAPDSNAAPMLAGLGIFGVVGVGWLVSRRRRIRAEF